MSKKTLSKDFDKYFYYHKSVQSPDIDVQFFDKAYKDIRGKEAVSLKEDFCGTFSISCEWVKLGDNKKAVGVDLDEEPIEYGKNNYLAELTDDQKSRVEVINANVMDKNNPQADIVSASNFSYYIFKDRETLKTYYKSAYNSVKDDGIFIVDCFGGTAATEPVEEETEQDGFSYFWDQDSFDPVTNFAQFYIHFKRKGEKKRKKVFSYDWRMWSIPEIREIMLEAGFKDTKVMWEGTDKDGDGDGKFKAVEKGEHCESWVAYVIGVK
jgi:SAM-dependent methyltransferase